MGDQERSRAGVEEGARQPRQALAAQPAVGRRGVAGREHDPVGVELELRDLAGVEQPVFVGARRRGRRQRQRRLALALELARQEAVGREGDDPVLAEVRAPHALLGRLRAQDHVRLRRLERLRDLPQLARRLAKPRQPAHELDVHSPALPAQLRERGEIARVSRGASEGGIAEPDEGLGRLRAAGDRAQALQRAHRRQDADGHLLAEERHRPVVPLLGRGRQLRGQNRLGNEKTQRQAEERPRRHDDQVRGAAGAASRRARSGRRTACAPPPRRSRGAGRPRDRAPGASRARSCRAPRRRWRRDARGPCRRARGTHTSRSAWSGTRAALRRGAGGRSAP